jgi:hypothetical protein
MDKVQQNKQRQSSVEYGGKNCEWKNIRKGNLITCWRE